MTERLVVVGCGTVVPEGDRACSAYWAELGGRRFLLDCGSGAVQALARLGLPWQDLDDLVLTHFHADHVGALPGLFFALKHGLWPRSREHPLRVWGPPGTDALLRKLAAALGDYLLDPGFPVEVREPAAGEQVDLGDARLALHPTPHTEESRAVRLESTAVALGYTGDTGPGGGVGAFLSGVDLLIAECSLPDDLASDNHLSPSRVAALAREARPCHLLLTHVYPQFRAAADVPLLVAAAGWTGRVALAREGWTWVHTGDAGGSGSGGSESGGSGNGGSESGGSENGGEHRQSTTR